MTTIEVMKLKIRLQIKHLKNQIIALNKEIIELRRIYSKSVKENKKNIAKQCLERIVNYEKHKKSLLLLLKTWFNNLQSIEEIEDKKVIKEVGEDLKKVIEKKEKKKRKTIGYSREEVIYGKKGNGGSYTPDEEYEELERAPLEGEEIEESLEIPLGGEEELKLDEDWSKLSEEIVSEIDDEFLSDIEKNIPTIPKTEPISILPPKKGKKSKEKEISEPQQTIPAGSISPSLPVTSAPAYKPDEGLGAGGKLEGAEPKSIKRYADIISNKEMELKKENKITIQLKRKIQNVFGVIVTMKIEIQKKEIPEIEVFIMGPGFEIPNPRQKLLIPLNRDSDILEFKIIPKELGNRFIFVEFYQKGQMIGRTILEVNIKSRVKNIEHTQKLFNFSMMREVNIDATLRIIKYEKENRFIFSLFTKHSGTIVDPKASFGTMDYDKDYIKNLNALIREVAFDFDNPDNALETIIKLGKKVYHLIPEPMREAIKKINPKFLIFETGDLFVPFELAHDGENFLCLKYCIGKRILDEARDFISPPICFGAPDFDFILVESNPKQDLNLREKEFIKEIVKNYNINFTVLSGTNANKKSIEDIFFDPLEIIHFAGHGKFNDKNPDKSGILLDDGTLTANDIRNSEINGFPLIFANTCESATISKVNKMKGVGGLARAFLGAGAIGFIGPLWEITDDLAAEFANEFYKKVIDDHLSVGEAIKEVKSELKTKYSHILWATFNYYGDPTLKLCPKINI